MQLPYRLRIALTIFGMCAALLTNVAACEEEKGKQENGSPSIVLRNATIHSMSSEGTFVGSVVVTNGRIAAIGKQVESPANAQVYNLEGFHLTPGLIESRGKLWLTAQAISEGNAKAELKVVDAIDPWSEDWRELAAQGITSVYVQPNSTSAVGGMGAVLRVGPHGSIDDIVMKDDVAVQVSIGTRGRSSTDRYKQIQALEKLLKSAQDKKKVDEDQDNKDDKQDSDGKQKESEEESDEEEEDDKEGDKEEDKDKDGNDKEGDEEKDDEKKDVTKEIFKRVLKREIPLFVEVHHSDSLKRVIALAKEFKIRIVLDGLSKVTSCVDDLKDCSHAMVLGPFFESGEPPEYRKDGDLKWFTGIDAGDKLWALSTFTSTARGSQALRINAARAVNHGVDSGEVLKSLTANAARILGVSEQVGTLEEGKQADIAVFAGDPMDSSTPARLVLSHGQVVFESDVAAKETKEFSQTVSLPELMPESYAVSTSRMLRGGKLAPGTIVVVDGRISAVEDQSNARKDELQIFDLGDTIVTPGLVIAHTSLGQATMISDPMESDASHLRAVDAFDPTTKKAKETLAAGFIHIGLAPGVGNTSSGAMGHVRLGVGDYVVSPTIANQFVLANPARNRERFPASLNGQVSMINNLFGGSLVDSRVYLSDRVAKSIAAEKLACVKEVAEGKRKAIFLADEKVEIRAVVTLTRNNKLPMPTLASSGPVGDLASELADNKMGLLVSPISTTDLNRRPDQIKAAISAGVPIGFVGDSADQVRITASMLSAIGVSAETVLSGLTEGGASLVGMKNIGLEPGAKADFVVWSDNPINLAAKPLNVVVGGKPVSKK